MAVPSPGEPPPVSGEVYGENSSPLLDSTLLPAEIVSQLHDSLYGTLENHFFKTGQGRRKALPDFCLVTNKLLLQLFCLKTEHGASWNEVSSWFWKLFPSLDNVTSGRLAYFIGKATRQDWNQFDLVAASQQVVDLQTTIPTPLLSFGLNRTILFDDPSKFHLDGKFVISNDVCYSLETFRSRERLKNSFVFNWLLQLGKYSELPFQFDYSGVKRRCEKIFKLVKNFQKRGQKDKLRMFLEEPVFSEEVTSLKKKENTCSVCDSNISLLKDLSKQNEVLKFSISKKEEELKNVNLKFKALSEEKKEMLYKILDYDTLKEEISKLKAKEIENASYVEEFKRSKIYKSNCQYKKTLTVERQKNMQLKHKNVHLNKTIENLVQKCDSLKTNLDEKNEIIQTLRKQLKSEQTLKSKYKNKMTENTSILNMLEEEEKSQEIKLKEDRHNQFSDSVRLTYMALMGEANIPAQNCSKVVEIISRYLFSKPLNLEQLPSTSTVLNFSNEAYHIAQHQIVDKIKQSEHFTLATDGTSRQKKQYLERHIVLDNKCSMSLGFTEIVRDDANTLLEKTIEILDDLCEIYCLRSERESKDDIFKEVIQKLKCLMSDRAAVMKSFDKKMLEYKQNLLGEKEAIHFLFCNAHFLLGLATAAEKASSKVEKGFVKLGRDVDKTFFKFSNAKEVAAFRLIRTASEVFGPRGDEKCGCREEWLAYCILVVKKPSKFTSFRTNRFNNVFENAYALIYHFEDIILFLTKHVSHSNLKLQSILADVKDIHLISIIYSIALFQINFTGPYWNLMNSSKSYGEFPEYVKKMKQSLEKWNCENFDPIQTKLIPVFEESFQLSYVDAKYMNDFLSKCEKDTVTNMFKEITNAFGDVLERQLDDFLDGGVFSGELSLDDKKILYSCPLTNLTGERIFGDLDYDINKRRHASLHFRSTLNMWKRNKTIRWLDGQNKSAVKKILLDAKKNAGKWKKRSREREKRIRLKVKERIINNKKEREEKHLKQLQKKTLALDALIDQGGLCETKESLDDIMAGPNSLQKLKDQLKFRKVVLGENLSFTGNTQILYKRLCSHLGFDCDPPPKRPRLN